MKIRRAEIQDLPAIVEIYNEAILNTVATFDTEPRTLQQQEVWYRDHGDAYPILVSEDGNHITGWSSLNRYSDRLAYARTAELSLYIREGHRGQGTGKILLEAVLEAGKAAGLHTALSRIVEGNDSSIHIHRQYGFETVGTMREVGFKFGRMLDVILMQKML